MKILLRKDTDWRFEKERVSGVSTRADQDVTKRREKERTNVLVLNLMRQSNLLRLRGELRGLSPDEPVSESKKEMRQSRRLVRVCSSSTSLDFISFFPSSRLQNVDSRVSEMRNDRPMNTMADVPARRRKEGRSRIDQRSFVSSLLRFSRLVLSKTHSIVAPFLKQIGSAKSG